MHASERDKERFRSKLRKQGDCLVFVPQQRSRYGQFNYQCQETGVRIRIAPHRFSYLMHFGHIPDGMFIMHQCDNPRCCNPSHLSLGTPRDNFEDMVQKGRHPFFKSKERRKKDSRLKIDLFWIRRKIRKQFPENQ